MRSVLEVMVLAPSPLLSQMDLYMVGEIRFWRLWRFAWMLCFECYVLPNENNPFFLPCRPLILSQWNTRMSTSPHNSSWSWCRLLPQEKWLGAMGWWCGLILDSPTGFAKRNRYFWPHPHILQELIGLRRSSHSGSLLHYVDLVKHWKRLTKGNWVQKVALQPQLLGASVLHAAIDTAA